MKTGDVNQNPAITELMNQGGGIDANMVGVYFQSPDMLQALWDSIKDNQVISDVDRIYIEPLLFFSIITGCAF